MTGVCDSGAFEDRFVRDPGKAPRELLAPWVYLSRLMLGLCPARRSS